MKKIIVDHEKCRKDYLCISECPYAFIFNHDASGFPVLNKEAEKYCIDCRHCVAICPNNALSFSVALSEEYLSIQEELMIDADQLEQFLKARRSYRIFKQKPVLPEILSRLIDVTRWAPTASNRQPVEWLIVQDHNGVKEIAALVIEWLKGWLKENNRDDNIIEAWNRGEDIVLRKAPHLIIAHTSSESHWADVDSAIALTYLELMANTMGLGACWAGFFTTAANSYAPLMRKLALPENHKVGGAMMVGYRSNKFQHIPQRKPAKVVWR